MKKTSRISKSHTQEGCFRRSHTWESRSRYRGVYFPYRVRTRRAHGWRTNGSRAKKTERERDKRPPTTLIERSPANARRSRPPRLICTWLRSLRTAATAAARTTRRRTTTTTTARFFRAPRTVARSRCGALYKPTAVLTGKRARARVARGTGREDLSDRREKDASITLSRTVCARGAARWRCEFISFGYMYILRLASRVLLFILLFFAKKCKARDIYNFNVRLYIRGIINFFYSIFPSLFSLRTFVMFKV